MDRLKNSKCLMDRLNNSKCLMDRLEEFKAFSGWLEFEIAKAFNE